MDEADRAQLQNEIAEAARLLQRKPEGPKATGRCLNCNEKLQPDQKFCDVDCSEDYDLRERMRRYRR